MKKIDITNLDHLDQIDQASFNQPVCLQNKWDTKFKN